MVLCRSTSFVLAMAGVASAQASTLAGTTSTDRITSCLDWVRGGNACVWLFVLVLLFVVVAIAMLLVHAAQRVGQVVAISTLPTSFFFWLGIGYLILLLLIGLFYALERGDKTPFMLGGILPIAVPWFGALGAVTISLAGVFFFSDQGWDKRYNYWHIGRPLFGAVLGIVAYFIFILILGSAGTSVPILAPEAKPAPTAKDYIIYYVLAFLVGYREETFRELIQRVTDLILKPGTPGDDQPSVTFKHTGAPTTAWDFGQVTAGAPATVNIEIANAGKASLHSPNVALDSTSGKEFSIASNQLAGLAELKAGESKFVDIKFAPTAAGNFTGALLVTGVNLKMATKLPLTGKS
jgi:hypothetical protein